MVKLKRVVLKNGKLLFGEIKEDNNEYIIIKTSRGEKKKVKRKNISHII